MVARLPILLQGHLSELLAPGISEPPHQVLKLGVAAVVVPDGPDYFADLLGTDHIVDRDRDRYCHQGECAASQAIGQIAFD